MELKKFKNLLESVYEAVTAAVESNRRVGNSAT